MHGRRLMEEVEGGENDSANKATMNGKWTYIALF